MRTIKTIDRAKEYKTDYMQGNGKGNQRDSLTRQRPGLRRKLSPDDITALYADSRMVQNIINIPAEDMTRAWFTLRMDDNKLAQNVMAKLADLKARDALRKMRMFERMRGDGFVSIGVSEFPNFNLEDPLEESNLKSVDYLHPFSSLKVNEFLMNDDVFSNDYGKLELVEINRASRNGLQNNPSQSAVHISRMLHDQTRRLEDEEQGQSLIESMYDVLTVFDTTLWSVGQILHDFTLKVYKSQDIEGMEAQDKRELSMLMDFMFRTEALAMIGKEEELNKQTTSVGGIKELLDFVWDTLSGTARMPKTVLKGQEAGTIAGAQYDVMNYYSRIAASQENELKPHIERLIRLILLSENDVGGRKDPDSIEWEIKFNPLWQVDSKTDAEIRKLVAETDQIYLVNGVTTEDEVRDARFGQFGLTNEIKFSGDEEDLKRMADHVYEAWKENGSRGEA